MPNDEHFSAAIMRERDFDSHVDAFVKAHDDYLHGKCDVFAAALHRLTGIPIGMAIYFDAEIESTCGVPHKTSHSGPTNWSSIPIPLKMLSS